jgi:hypothetical protein
MSSMLFWREVLSLPPPPPPKAECVIIPFRRRAS